MAAGVGRSAISTVVAPADSGKVSALPRPYAKNSLAAEKQTSPSRSPRYGPPYSTAVQYRFACVCTVPLGRPVEPDEYSQNAMSSARVSKGAGQGGAASSVANPRVA